MSLCGLLVKANCNNIASFSGSCQIRKDTPLNKVKHEEMQKKQLNMRDDTLELTEPDHQQYAAAHPRWQPLKCFPSNA